ncbi:MAG: peptidoglycan-binding protein [Pseudomonadota bacterium]
MNFTIKFSYIIFFLISIIYGTNLASAQSKEEAKAIQRNLNQLGYGAGTIDGAIGKGTRAAIRSFQYDYGLGVTGEVNIEQFNLLGSEANRLKLGARLKRLEHRVTSEFKRLLPSCLISSNLFTLSTREEKSDGRCGYVNENGQWVMYPDKDQVREFSDGYSYYIDDGKTYLIDRNLKPLSVGFFSYNKRTNPYLDIACIKQSRCGVFEPDRATWILEPKYKSIAQTKNFLILTSNKQIFLYSKIDGTEIDISSLFDQNVPTIYEISDQFLLGDTYKNKDMFIFDKFGKRTKSLNSFEGAIQDCKGDFIFNLKGGGRQHFDSKKMEVTDVPYIKQPTYYADGCPEFVVNKFNAVVNSKTDAIVRHLGSEKNIEFSHATKDFYYEYQRGEPRIFKRLSDDSIVATGSKRAKIYGHGPNASMIIDGNRVAFWEDKMGSWKSIATFQGDDYGSQCASNRKLPIISYGGMPSRQGGCYYADISTNTLVSIGAKREIVIFEDACDFAIGRRNRENDNLHLQCYFYYEQKNDVEDSAASNYALGWSSMLFGYDEGIDYIRRGAEKGHSDAQLALGNEYYKGSPNLSIKQSFEDAAYWWQRAAAGGNTYAMNNIGVLYFNGEFFPKDYEKSYYWYKRAVGRGNYAGLKTYNQLENYFKNQSAARRQKASGQSLLDVFQTLKGYSSSSSNFKREQAASQARNQCVASKRQCTAQCEGLPKSKGVRAGFGPYGKCKSECRAKSCY